MCRFLSFKKVVLSSLLIAASSVAIAKNFECPSTNELSTFEGFYIEYPLSLNTQTQKPNTWIVGQVRAKQRAEIVDSLIISPVQSVEGEYPADSAAKMIPSLELLESNPAVVDVDHVQVHICSYWSAQDGSFASFINLKDKKLSTQAPFETMSLAMKALAQQSKIKNIK